MSSQDFSATERQRQIYIEGLSGQKPLVPISFDKLQARAKEKMSKAAYTYIAGGAGRESTVTDNRTGFNQWKIIPRMLRDVSIRDTAIELFGQRLTSPLLLSPVGVLEEAHPEADIAVAKAATKLGIPYIFSNQASKPMEACAAVMGDSPRWFQLYWSKSNELVKSFVQRAEKCNCSAIVVTLDTTILGWRIQDLDIAYVPFMHGKGIAQYVSDPVFNRFLDEPDDPNAPQVKPKITFETLSNIIGLMRHYPGGFIHNIRSQRPLRAVRLFTNIFSRPSLERFSFFARAYFVAYYPQRHYAS